MTALLWVLAGGASFFVIGLLVNMLLGLLCPQWFWDE